MKAPETVRYVHRPTGAIRSGRYVRDLPAHNSIVVATRAGQVAVHRENVLEDRPCPECQGDGFVYERNHVSPHYAGCPDDLYDRVGCWACEGTGRVPTEASHA